MKTFAGLVVALAIALVYGALFYEEAPEDSDAILMSLVDGMEAPKWSTYDEGAGWKVIGVPHRYADSLEFVLVEKKIGGRRWPMQVINSSGQKLSEGMIVEIGELHFQHGIDSHPQRIFVARVK